LSQQTDHLKTVLARHEDVLLRQDAGGSRELLRARIAGRERGSSRWSFDGMDRAARARLPESLDHQQRNAVSVILKAENEARLRGAVGTSDASETEYGSDT
jgi:hypothetical protein